MERIQTSVIALIASLEHEHGQARFFTEIQRQGLVKALGVGAHCHVLDLGRGKLATVGRRGGGFKVHDLRET